MLADQVVDYRPKIRFRYLLGILLAAVLAAAVLWHVLLVQTEFNRIEILGGAFSRWFSSVGGVVYERRFPLH
jgi:hypothetical protein